MHGDATDHILAFALKSGTGTVDQPRTSSSKWVFPEQYSRRVRRDWTECRRNPATAEQPTTHEYLPRQTEILTTPTGVDTWGAYFTRSPTPVTGRTRER
jgi:hypothetical protein